MVFATDTWFHFTTKSINLTQVYPLTASLNASVGLVPNCYDVNETYSVGCTLNPGASATFLIGGSNTLKVMSNLSDAMQVNTLQSGKDSFTFVGNSPKAGFESVDYKSYSWAMKTQCAPVTTQCVKEENIAGAFFRYKCPFAMEGTMSTDANTAFQNQFTMAYFTNSSATSNSTYTTNLANPYYFATIATVNQNLGHGPASLAGDPEVSSTGHGADLFALICNATVYDLSYTSINGSISVFDAKPANSTITNIVQGTQQYTNVGDPNLIQGASIAAIISPTAQDLADYFALTYSQVALGVATAAFTPQPAIVAQTRDSILVAKVPIVPLACLLIANLSLALLGIVLVIFAAVAAKGETREVQARLSVTGLVAAHFEGGRTQGQVEKVEDLFEERERKGVVMGPRVGLLKNERGGWMFSVWRAG